MLHYSERWSHQGAASVKLPESISVRRERSNEIPLLRSNDAGGRVACYRSSFTRAELYPCVLNTRGTVTPPTQMPCRDTSDLVQATSNCRRGCTGTKQRGPSSVSEQSFTVAATSSEHAKPKGRRQKYERGIRRWRSKQPSMRLRDPKISRSLLGR